MNENILSASISRLRKEHGLTQDALAAKLGVTYQAVSKWENGASCPDVMLLPEIADIFNVTVDELFAREVPSAEVVPAPSADFMADIPCTVPWEDDGTLRVVLFHGRELLQAIPEDTAARLREFPFVYNGPAINISSVLNVYCNNCDIEGDVSACGNVFCSDVGGDVSANGSVECADVSGNVDAQGSVHCSDISGNVKAGGNVDCSDVGGNIAAGGEVDCGDVEGNAAAGGNLSCGDVGGGVSAGGDVSADDIDGDVIASRDVRCGDIDGDVRAGGSIKCGDVSGNVHGTGVDTGNDSSNFSIEFGSFDSDEFKSDVNELARKAEEMAKNAINMSKNFLDQLNFNIGSSSKHKPKKPESSPTKPAEIVPIEEYDYDVSDIINDEIDAAIGEAVGCGDFGSISDRINEKMSKISEKIDQHFNDKYGSK